MMVIFLVGLVTMIMLRTLRRDYARYSNIEEQVDIVSENTIILINHTPFN